jgi:hypothetical protein
VAAPQVHMEWADAEELIRTTGRWEHYLEMRMGAGANLSVTEIQDHDGRTIYRAEASWQNWSLFTVMADYDTAEAALVALPLFAVALTDLLGEKDAWRGLSKKPPEPAP